MAQDNKRYGGFKNKNKKIVIKFINILKELAEESDYASNEFEKVTPETLKKIGSRDRIVLGTKDSIDFNFKIPPSRIGFKPTGLWYGFGTSWIDFIRAEMPERETEHVFKIDIYDDDIIDVDKEGMFLWFSKRYKDPEKEGRFGNHKIDWPEVTKKYKGIEFPIYFDKYRGDPEHQWYYPWDIASGCIWDLSAIKKVTKLQ